MRGSSTSSSMKEDASLDGITLVGGVPTNPPYAPPAGTGLAANSCLMIGTEAGFLPFPVNQPLNVPFAENALTGAVTATLCSCPRRARRHCRRLHGTGREDVYPLHDTPAPFPFGDPLNDRLPNGTGKSPNTREIMQFRVLTPPASDLPTIPSSIRSAPSDDDNDQHGPERRPSTRFGHRPDRFPCPLTPPPLSGSSPSMKLPMHTVG